MKLILPAPVGRSPTAVPDRSDFRDENVFSAGVVQHGGTGTLSLFTVPKGQTIPYVKGSAITAPTATHQTTYSALTTNLVKAGEVGNGLGDISIRAVAINCEAAAWTDAGARSAIGMGVRELADVQSKMFFELKIGQKKYVEGPIYMFGCSGGMFGSVSTTVNAGNLAIVRNGDGPRRLKLPILAGRSDTLEATLNVAGSDGLSFTTSTGVGCASLMWVHLFANVRGDAR